MTELFGLVVRFTLRPGVEADFDQLVLETVRQIKTTEPGTLLYICHHVAEKPDQRIFYELYRNRDAFLAHEEQEHVKRFLAERDQFMAEVQVDFMAPYTGGGVPGATD